MCTLCEIYCVALKICDYLLYELLREIIFYVYRIHSYDEKLKGNSKWLDISGYTNYSILQGES